MSRLLHPRIIVCFFFVSCLSILSMPTFWAYGLPPFIPLLIAYGMIWRSMSFHVWFVCFLGVFAGALTGSPMGVDSFMYVLLVASLALLQRHVSCGSTISAWVVWVVVMAVYLGIQVTLMGVLGFDISLPLWYQPVLATVIVSPLMAYVFHSLLPINTKRIR